MTFHLRITAVCAALALGANAAPASARPFDLNADGSLVPAGTAARGRAPIVKRIRADSELAKIEREQERRAARHVRLRRARSSPPTSAWGDAGTGAAAGVLLAMLALGASLAMLRRRRRRRGA